MVTGTLPTGTVTFLFTDIEGSTKRWETHAEQMQRALQRHDTLLRQAIEANNGYVFKTVGDAFCAAFPTAVDALASILSAHRALQAEEWGEIGPLKIRAGLHTGIAHEREGDYFGPTLNRVARLQAAGHGQQTLLSLPTYELLRDNLPTGVELIDLGEHRLKDLIRPEHVFQLVAPDLPSEFPPLKTLDNHPNNLPRQATALIGREKELGEVYTLLSRADANLVTFTGPGGTGKTRLSLQAAADMLDDFADGVWFVELAALIDHNLVASTIAQTLGVTEAAGRPIVESLKDYLQEKQILLVLDNFEQVAEAATQVGQLLAAAPRLKVLVTSRVPLRIRGEKEYAVPPLGLPAEGAWRAMPLPAQQLTQYEAVRLFIERATDVKSDFEVTNENAPSVAEICVRLDGLPLAIELAAARVRLFPPHALLGRLSNRLKMLTGGARDLSARQQTLRGTIDWSYDLLHEGEKQFFRRMAVFQGGRTLEGLEAVCDADGMLQVDVLEGVESLVSNSLLQQREGSDGEPRFWILETIHEYAREKLQESGEAELLQREHALYFMRLAGEAEPHLKGSSQQEWLERLEDEHDNIRSALRWARAGGGGDEGSETVEIGLRTAGAVWRFWNVRGYYSEGREVLQELASQAARQGSSKEWGAKALNGAGILANGQGDYSTAHSLLEGALALGKEVGDNKSIANSLNNLGNVVFMQGDYATARSLYEESLALRREIGDKWGIAASLMALGNVVSDQGDYATARSFYEESLALKREIGDKTGISGSLISLGNVALTEGDYPAARSFYEESLRVSRELGHKGLIAASLGSLGIVASEQGDYATARSLYEESLALFRELGERGSIAATLHNLGHIAYMQLDYPIARAMHLESLQIRQEIGEKWGIAVSLAGLGEVAVESGQPQRGARLLGASDAMLEAIDAVMGPDDHIPYDRAVASARSQLGEEAFEQARQEGRAMSMEEAIEYALALTLEG